MSLDELLLLGRRPGLQPICAFAGLELKKPMQAFFYRRMSSELANSERWREGVTGRRAGELDRLYADALDRLEADGIRCAPLLRRTLERSRSPKADGPQPLAFLTGDGTPVVART